MIDAYVWNTPNGQKLTIALEELALPYELHWIDIMKGAQDTPAYRAINPNGKIPAIVDREGPNGKPLAVFESMAILQYLADKTGQLLPQDGAARYVALQWMAFNIGGVGPMTGQLAHFGKFASERVPYAIERYSKEVDRLHAVLDKRLGEARFLAGDEYSMADIINVTWIQNPTEFGLFEVTRPNLRRWLDEVLARPAVQRARALKPA